MRFSIQQIIIHTLLLISISSCTKEGQENNLAIPDVPINVRININDPIYNNLNNITGWAYLNEGSRGIILYRESLDIVRAYDRHCTFDPQEVCSTIDMNGAILQANDNDCCGSVFNITNNTILQGPATRPLKEYETTFDGTFIVIIN